MLIPWVSTWGLPLEKTLEENTGRWAEWTGGEPSAGESVAERSEKFMTAVAAMGGDVLLAPEIYRWQNSAFPL